MSKLPDSLLIVDDDIEFRRLFAGLLTRAGVSKDSIYHADSAHSGLVECEKQRPRLVLLDIGLPRQSGIEALESFALKFPAIPVIVLTALRNEVEVTRALAKGARGFVLKDLADRMMHELERQWQTTCQQPAEPPDSSGPRGATDTKEKAAAAPLPGGDTLVAPSPASPATASEPQATPGATTASEGPVTIAHYSLASLLAEISDAPATTTGHPLTQAEVNAKLAVTIPAATPGSSGAPPVPAERERSRIEAFLKRLKEVIAADRHDAVDQEARKFAREGGAKVAQAIVTADLAARDIVRRLWADCLDVAAVDPVFIHISSEAIAKVTHEYAKKLRVVPLYLLDSALTVAMENPTDQKATGVLATEGKVEISAVFALPDEIAAAIQRCYLPKKSLLECVEAVFAENLFAVPADTSARLDRHPVADSHLDALHQVFYFALIHRTSDVHFEAGRDACRVRFRIDGDLREMFTVSPEQHATFIAQLKILSKQSAIDHRLPMDGQFAIDLEDWHFDFRVSTVPTIHGEKKEKGVVRILSDNDRTLDQISMSKSVLNEFKRLIRAPQGLLFVTGPTGSGKTNTLYSALRYINRTDLNISTIENPVEIQLAGATQIQVQPDIGLTFEKGLRALLRQDPNVILVGEIRDADTAEIAIQAALTGHLVLATLHTNSASAAFQRLEELKTNRQSVAAATTGVLAQRLVKRICAVCKESYQPSETLLRKYFQGSTLPAPRFYRGKGCPACGWSGYKGRVAVHELVVVDRKIRGLIASEASPDDIAQAAAAAGQHRLLYDGLGKVLLGLTTIEEIENRIALDP